MKDGCCVHLANPVAIRLYDGLKYSGDFADAACLAQLLRLGLLPERYIYPAQGRQVRDLSRKRMQLEQCRIFDVSFIDQHPSFEMLRLSTAGQRRGRRQTQTAGEFPAIVKLSPSE
jgi:transposase